MIYLYGFLFLITLILCFRSASGKESYYSTSIADRVIMSLLWLHVALGFLENILKHFQ